MRLRCARASLRCSERESVGLGVGAEVEEAEAEASFAEDADVRGRLRAGPAAWEGSSWSSSAVDGAGEEGAGEKEAWREGEEKLREEGFTNEVDGAIGLLVINTCWC